jgi:hypothetical protein
MLPSLYSLPSLLVCILYIASCSAGLTLPVSYSINGNDFNISASNKITLSSDGNTPSVVVLDYGRNVEGYPTFKVVHGRGDTSAFEMSYAECLSSLDSYMVRDARPLPVPLSLTSSLPLVRRADYVERRDGQLPG